MNVTCRCNPSNCGIIERPSRRSFFLLLASRDLKNKTKKLLRSMLPWLCAIRMKAIHPFVWLFFSLLLSQSNGWRLLFNHSPIFQFFFSFNLFLCRVRFGRNFTIYVQDQLQFDTYVTAMFFQLHAFLMLDGGRKKKLNRSCTAFCSTYRLRQTICSVRTFVLITANIVYISLF